MCTSLLRLEGKPKVIHPASETVMQADDFPDQSCAAQNLPTG